MISVIIPIYNEEKGISNTLSQQALQNSSDIELIVVDGGSSDRSCSLAKQHKNIQLLHSGKGRAKQLNAGAQYASGEWLLFLHADTLLPENAIQEIKALDKLTDIKAGGFRHQFSGDDWRLTFISWLNNLRCSHNRIFYGDQAMFVRRDLFKSLGGFPAQNILEDVFFSVELNKHTRPILLNSYAITDARKFISMGIWRSLFRVATIQSRIRLGLPVAENYVFFKDAR